MAFAFRFSIFRHCVSGLLLTFLILQSPYVGLAIVCYKCDSLTLAECAMSLDTSELPIEDCRTSTQCVMSIVDAITYRGCSSDTPIAGASYQKRCAENLCNKGVYPPGRLKCHQCAGGACEEEMSGKPHPCRWHREIDECYVEVLGDLSATYRGCASDTNHTISADSIVAYCDINGCNDAAALLTLRCAKCDSMEEPGCKTNLFEAGVSTCNITQYDSCVIRSVFTQPGSCFSYHSLDRVVRGCLDIMPPRTDDLSVCRGSDYCNTRCMQQQRCVACDSTTSSKCLENASDLAITTCGSAEASSCYACEYADWHVQRGCGPMPPTSGMSDRNRCFECDGSVEDKCNAKPFTRCYQCSSMTSNDCANWERPGFNVSIEDCMDPGARCVTAALLDGPTILRGCESERLHCNETLSACTTCEGSFCNKGAFPAHVLHCHQCSNCPTVQGLDPQPCVPQLSVVAGASEACFQHRTSEGIMRGCRSDSTRYFQCLHQNANTASAGCHVCHTDGCNNGSLKAAATLSCYTCKRGDFSCQDDQIVAEGELQRCRNAAPQGLEASCFITRHIDGTTTRGCTWDHLTSSLTELWDQTNYCSHSSGCNSPATRFQYCVRCKMYLEENVDPDANACASAAFQLDAAVCNNAADDCYIAFMGPVLIRGCSSELTSVQYENCRTDNNCHLCQGQRCNTMAVNSTFEMQAQRSSAIAAATTDGGWLLRPLLSQQIIYSILIYVFLYMLNSIRI